MVKEDSFPFGMAYFQGLLLLVSGRVDGCLMTNIWFKSNISQPITGWWFQICFMFTPIWGRWTHFDSYFSTGLKPQTRSGFHGMSSKGSRFTLLESDEFQKLVSREAQRPCLKSWKPPGMVVIFHWPNQQCTRFFEEIRRRQLMINPRHPVIFSADD